MFLPPIPNAYRRPAKITVSGEPPLIFPAGVRRTPLSILWMGIGGAWYGLEIFWRVSVFVGGVLGWLSAVFKGPDEFNDEDDGGAQEDEEVAQVEYYFFEPSVLNAEVIYYVVADQSVVKVAGGAA